MADRMVPVEQDTMRTSKKWHGHQRVRYNNQEKGKGSRARDFPDTKIFVATLQGAVEMHHTKMFEVFPRCANSLWRYMDRNGTPMAGGSGLSSGVVLR